MRRFLIISFSFLLLCATTAAAQSADGAGTWDATLTSPQGSFNVQLILKQDGEKLSGVVKNQQGETPIEGTLTGKDLKLKYTIKFQDNDMVITMTATVDGAAIKGKADYGGLADGDFTAKRAGATAAAPSAPAMAAPATGEKMDVTGAWVFQVETSAGAGSPTFTFKQDGENITGQYKGTFGEAPLTGTVKGTEIKFSIKASAQGQEATLTYIGTIAKDGMKGTAQLGEMGAATWTGKRQ